MTAKEEKEEFVWLLLEIQRLSPERYEEIMEGLREVVEAERLHKVGMAQLAPHRGES